MSADCSPYDPARLAELVLHARRHSRYYAEAYAGLPEDCRLDELPLIDTTRFWQIEGDIGGWAALTEPLRQAMVFRSGGSTGNGKWSLCTRHEWEHLCACYGAAVSTRLVAGDRVANLFFGGNLYASHLFIHTSLSYVEVPICLLPFAGMFDLESLAHGLQEHAVTVLAGLPAHLVQLAAHLNARGATLPRVQTILYGGDSMFNDQLAVLACAFPRARVASIGYASVDVGVLGASLPDCEGGEHRCFDGETILEIIDGGSGAVIEQPQQPGMLVATSLSRRLTPLIRCPTGDLARWIEPAGTPRRKFELLGRSTTAHQLRVGYATLVPSAIEDCIIQALHATPPWQLTLRRDECIDYLTVRIAAPNGGTDSVLACLLSSQPGLSELVQANLARVDIEWCALHELHLDARTGKLRRVIDHRDVRLTQ